MIARSELPLAGVRVLVTRPARQALALCRGIESAGGEAHGVPAIELVPPADPDLARRLLEDRASTDCVIFISRGAVEFASRLVPDLAGLLVGRPVFAAGTGTLGELTRRGVESAVAPSRRSGTEGLLRLDALREAAVSGQDVLIVRGEGGREALREELEKRGARVRYAEVYARRRPGTAELNGVWRASPPDIIVTTSNEGLENLVEMTDAGRRETLLSTPLIVTSRRAATRAAELGFRGRVATAASADDGELLECLVNLVEEARGR